jgi:hypothetical protein
VATVQGIAPIGREVGGPGRDAGGETMTEVAGSLVVGDAVAPEPENLPARLDPSNATITTAAAAIGRPRADDHRGTTARRTDGGASDGMR